MTKEDGGLRIVVLLGAGIAALREDIANLAKHHRMGHSEAFSDAHIRANHKIDDLAELQAALEEGRVTIEAPAGEVPEAIDQDEDNEPSGGEGDPPKAGDPPAPKPGPKAGGKKGHPKTKG